MSYNITNLSIKKINVVLSEKVLKDFIINTIFDAFGGEWKVDFTKSNKIIFSSDDDGTNVIFEERDTISYKLVSFGFSSSFDPGDLPDKIHKLIALVQGELEALYVWESGDSVDLVKIENGKITNKELN